jgi:hypothetical protein
MRRKKKYLPKFSKNVTLGRPNQSRDQITNNGGQTTAAAAATNTAMSSINDYTAVAESLNYHVD